MSTASQAEQVSMPYAAFALQMYSEGVEAQHSRVEDSPLAAKDQRWLEKVAAPPVVVVLGEEMNPELRDLAAQGPDAAQAAKLLQEFLQWVAAKIPHTRTEPTPVSPADLRQWLCQRSTATDINEVQQQTLQMLLDTVEQFELQQEVSQALQQYSVASAARDY